MLITPLQPLRVEGPREATDVGVEFKGASVGVERRRGGRVGIETVGCAERHAGRESPQGTAFITPTRSYGDQCEI
jgi:hypothetical protein